MKTQYAVTGSPIFLGRKGEDRVREIVFNIGGWVKRYGEGSVQLLAHRTEEDLLYPVPIERRDGDRVVWTVTAADVGIPGETGECELTYTSVTGQIKKSETWRTTVLVSLYGDVSDPPDPTQHWVDKARDNLAKVDMLTERAAQYAGNAASDAAKASSARMQAELSSSTVKQAALEVREVVTDVRNAASTALTAKDNAVGFLFDGIRKDEFFPYV